MLNWCTLNNKTLRRTRYFHHCVQIERSKTFVQSFETTSKFSAALLFFLGCWGLQMQTKVDNTSKDRIVFLLEIKCCYVSLAFGELISLSPKLYHCQLAGLLKLTHFLTVSCQWLHLSEIPSHVCSLANVVSINLFFFCQIRHNRCLKLIALWGSCKTKAANLSARVWTVLASEYSLSLWACVRQKFEEEEEKMWQLHFRCSDVTQPFWLKSSLNVRFGLLWCEVSSDAILACYLPAVLCHPLLQTDMGAARAEVQPFIPGDYKLKMWGGCTMTNGVCTLPPPVFSCKSENIKQEQKKKKRESCCAFLFFAFCF